MMVTTEQRIMALVRAANNRWEPGRSVLETDETDTPVFSDQEYGDFVSLVEVLGHAEWTRQMMAFLRLPAPMIDTLVEEMLRARLVTGGRRSGGMPFVVRKGAAPGGES